tara:strand:- start:857 stop:1120 length:264 start_codon:yes stop_codon:yes gene_type:complete
MHYTNRIYDLLNSTADPPDYEFVVLDSNDSADRYVCKFFGKERKVVLEKARLYARLYFHHSGGYQIYEITRTLVEQVADGIPTDNEA